jgi:hypothetical protein
MCKNKKKTCDEQEKTPLIKKARAKFLSQNLAIQLIAYNPESELIKSYGNSYYCCNVLLQSGKELKSKYCKTRWCALCNRIRTAKAMNAYLPAIEKMGEVYFVTLTKKTVEEKELKTSMDLMELTWRSILKSWENQKHRKIKGLRKIENTSRPQGKYHYHFHILIQGKENAEWLVSEWLRKMGGEVNAKAQDVRKADEGSLKEMFKYFTKLTVQNKTGESPGGVPQLIDYKRMDVIFRSMRGKRVYQGFGGLKSESEDFEEIQTQEYDFLESCEKVWNWRSDDWIDEWGECLTGYSPSDKFKEIFNHDKETQKI